MLFYFYTEPNLQIWLLDAQGIRAYVSEPLPLAGFAAAKKDLWRALGVEAGQVERAPQRRGLDIPRPNASLPPLAPAIAHMTELLLPAPIAKSLAAVKELIIVPVLDLGTVPYALLRPFNYEEALIERMSLYLAPSLFELAPEMTPWLPNFQDVLVVGNPAFTDKSPMWRLPPLKGAEQEATAIAAQFETKPLIGKAATKRAVIARAQTADLLYFATHGVADPKNSRQGSFLALSEERDDLGLWTMAEILQRHYPARLAVLSACQTGLGETYKGGVMALGRTFQVAGVPRVVMSLWNIDDKATAELMQSFINYLRSELPAQALRHAMRDGINRHRSPALWSPFVFFGTPERIQRQS